MADHTTALKLPESYLTRNISARKEQKHSQNTQEYKQSLTRKNNMKTASTPIEIWHSVPTLRTFLKDNNIIVEDSEGKITIPTFKCNIEKPTE